MCRLSVEAEEERRKKKKIIFLGKNLVMSVKFSTFAASFSNPRKQTGKITVSYIKGDLETMGYIQQ